MTHDSGAELQAGHDHENHFRRVAKKPQDFGPPSLVWRSYSQGADVHLRYTKKDSNANKSTEQFAQNANCQA
jgi:hypothetical protein